ncbi:MAG: glycine cleavage system protein GcvH [Phycisphaeraceae bacterium]|nr:glycine cleavage system protein GcvH [Phycisphaeraceae bacterium]
MASPADRRYSDTHEWFHSEGTTVTVGITRHAVDQLTDITFADMKPVGSAIAAGGSVGEVESVKTASEIYSAIPGTVAEINQALRDDPSILNSDPYGRGWIVKLTVTDPAAVAQHMAKLHDAAAYDSKNGG